MLSRKALVLKVKVNGLQKKYIRFHQILLSSQQPYTYIKTYLNCVILFLSKKKLNYIKVKTIINIYYIVFII